MTAPRYHQGQQITTLMDCLAFILAGANFCIPGGLRREYRVVPSAFLQNWSICQLQVAIRGGRLHLAELNEVIHG